MTITISLYCLPPRSSALTLSCSCCLRPRSLKLLLLSGPFRSLFFLGTALSLFCPLRLCPAERVTFLPAEVISFHGPQFPWVQDFLKTAGHFSAKFIRDPQFPRVSSFDSPRRPAACFLPLFRFFRPSVGFTTASSSGAKGFVCEAVSQQRVLYICLSRGRFLVSSSSTWYNITKFNICFVKISLKFVIIFLSKIFVSLPGFFEIL
jgi:hypothetical protein